MLINWDWWVAFNAINPIDSRIYYLSPKNLTRNYYLSWKSNQFCSQKSSSYATPNTGSSSQQQQGSGSGIEYSGYGYGSEYIPGSGVGTGSGYLGSGGSTESGGGSVLADGSYLAGLAMGDSPRTASLSALQFAVVAFTSLSLMCSCFFYS